MSTISVIAILKGEGVRRIIPLGDEIRVKGDTAYVSCKIDKVDGRIALLRIQEIVRELGLEPHYEVNYTRRKSTDKGFTVILTAEDGTFLQPFFQNEEKEIYGFRTGYSVFVHKNGTVNIKNIRIAIQNGIPFLKEVIILDDHLPLRQGKLAAKQFLAEEFHIFLKAILKAYEILFQNGDSSSSTPLLRLVKKKEK